MEDHELFHSLFLFLFLFPVSSIGAVKDEA